MNDLSKSQLSFTKSDPLVSSLFLLRAWLNELFGQLWFEPSIFNGIFLPFLDVMLSLKVICCLQYLQFIDLVTSLCFVRCSCFALLNGLLGQSCNVPSRFNGIFMPLVLTRLLSNLMDV